MVVYLLCFLSFIFRGLFIVLVVFYLLSLLFVSCLSCCFLSLLWCICCCLLSHVQSPFQCLPAPVSLIVDGSTPVEVLQCVAGLLVVPACMLTPSDEAEQLDMVDMSCGSGCFSNVLLRGKFLKSSTVSLHEQDGWKTQWAKAGGSVCGRKGLNTVIWTWQRRTCLMFGSVASFKMYDVYESFCKHFNKYRQQQVRPEVNNSNGG